MRYCCFLVPSLNSEMCRGHDRGDRSQMEPARQPPWHSSESQLRWGFVPVACLFLNGLMWRFTLSEVVTDSNTWTASGKNRASPRAVVASAHLCTWLRGGASPCDRKTGFLSFRHVRRPLSLFINFKKIVCDKRPENFNLSLQPPHLVEQTIATESASTPCPLCPFFRSGILASRTRTKP